MRRCASLLTAAVVAAAVGGVGSAEASFDSGTDVLPVSSAELEVVDELKDEYAVTDFSAIPEDPAREAALMTSAGPLLLPRGQFSAIGVTLGGARHHGVSGSGRNGTTGVAS